MSLITSTAMSMWWRVPSMPTPEEWQALSGWIGLLVAAVAALIALMQFGQSIANQREQSRPMIAVDLHFRSNIITVEVKNVGATAARDIQLDWSELPAISDDRVRGAFMRRLVDNPLIFLAPGRAIRFVVGSFPRYPEDGARHFEVVSSYQGPEAKSRWSSVSVFDLDQWAESLVEVDYENKNWNEQARQTAAMRQSARSSQDAADALATIAEFVEQQPGMIRLRAQQERDEVEQRLAPDQLSGLVFPNRAPQGLPKEPQAEELHGDGEE
ncbi:MULTISPECIES: hypothetical protein [unclassified Curtobacterium]|uniref:hypothetical protein n=1 Tax=unclassified Curtobacterium TaxID=257496 RepID=UPI00226B65A5|nr:MULTISPECIES: hypothetical protein [unclassified Curtobacterium]